MPRKFSKENLEVIASTSDIKEMRAIPYSDLAKKLNGITSGKKVTFIQYVCTLKHWDFVEKVTQNFKDDIESDIDDKAKFGTVLFAAVQENRIQTVRVLLEAGVVKRWIDNEGNTLFHIAVKNRNKEMIDLLLSYDSEIRTTCDKLPIELASYKKQWQCVEAIAKHQHTDATDKARYGYAFLSAVCENKIEIAKLLLDAGAPKNTASIYSADTALHKAVRKNNIPMIEMLLSADCDLTIENIEKQTPIQLAANLNHWEVVEAIAKHHKTDMHDRAKYSAVLNNAINANRVNTVKLLLDAGANIVTGNQDESKQREKCDPSSRFFGMFYHPNSEKEKTMAALERNLKSNR